MNNFYRIIPISVVHKTTSINYVIMFISLLETLQFNTYNLPKMYEVNIKFSFHNTSFSKQFAFDTNHCLLFMFINNFNSLQ